MKHFLFFMLALPLALAGGEWETVKNAWSAAESAQYERKGDELHIKLAAAGSGVWKKTFPLPAGGGVRISAEAAGPRTMNNNVVMTVKFLPRDPADKTPLPYHYVRWQDENGVRCFADTFAVPETAGSLEVRCIAKWMPGTETVFRKIVLAPAEAPKPRPVRIAALKMPELRKASTRAAALKSLDETADRVCTEKAPLDLLVLPEGWVATSTPDRNEHCEAVPGGETFRILSRIAAKHRTYIVANLHELDGKTVYNTSFIVGRDGKLVGKYRKVHLAAGEAEAGIAAGTEYPVFDLDFGKVGLMVCWDIWFPEPARILKQKGAELLVLSIAADGQPEHARVVWPARAIDNGIPLAVSIRGVYRSNAAAIYRCDGLTAASTCEDGNYAFAVLDLAERRPCLGLSVGYALGDPNELYRTERRPETYEALTE